MIKHEKGQTNKVFRDLKEAFGTLKTYLESDR